MGEAVAVGGDHGDRFGLEQHQGAVQRVAGLFVGDGESGAGDQAAQNLSRNFDDAGGWKDGQAGKVGLGHADHLGVGTAAANADPMVIEKFDGDVGVGKKFYVVVKLARGDGAGTILLYFGITGGSQAEIEVGGSEGKLAFGGLE